MTSLGTKGKTTLLILMIAVGAILLGVGMFYYVSPANAGAESSAGPREAHVTIVYSEKYLIDLGGLEKLHPADIHKYGKTCQKLVEEKLISAGAVIEPPPIEREDILRVHSETFLDSLKNPKTVARYLEAAPAALFSSDYLDTNVLLPLRYECGGTLLAARLALKHGIGINLGGGFHHGMPDHGEGFCIYNDIPIAVRVLQAEQLVKRVLIIDLDVHQGNGTAVCLQGDDTVFTFSMHQDDIYPNPKEESDLDIELAAGTGDKEYLDILQRHLGDLFTKANPELVIYQAGCDTMAGDMLAGLEMTEEGIARRDMMVVDAAVAHGAGVAMLLGGGYSKDAWHAQYVSIRGIITKYGLATTSK